MPCRFAMVSIKAISAILIASLFDNLIGCGIILLLSLRRYMRIAELHCFHIVDPVFAILGPEVSFLARNDSSGRKHGCIALTIESTCGMYAHRARLRYCRCVELVFVIASLNKF